MAKKAVKKKVASKKRTGKKVTTVKKSETMPDEPAYDFTSIEVKWQARSAEERIFEVHEDPNKAKFYNLEMYPYPSGNLHMGHLRNYSIGDAFTRYKRMRGFNVLYPMGFDAFGLPAENAAIKHRADPEEWTWKNINEIKAQLQRLGFSYDSARQVQSITEDYYSWNQWMFIKMWEKGLAYQEEAYVNWCPSCGTVLANEQVLNGKCWRCHSIVEQKLMTQWFFRIRNYADELLYCLKDLNWPERVKVNARELDWSLGRVRNSVQHQR